MADDLNEDCLDRGLAKDRDEGSNYGKNVRPVRARKKGRKMRRERERYHPEWQVFILDEMFSSWMKCFYPG